MATLKQTSQKGSALVVVIVIAVIVLLGVIFWYAWQANKENNDTNETNTTQDVNETEEDSKEVIGEIEESAEGQRHTMSFNGNAYEPQNLTIKVGDTVEFRNDSNQEMWPASNVHPSHEVYSDFDPKEAIAPGSGWSFKFEQAGQWEYHDHLTPSITGVITVEE